MADALSTEILDLVETHGAKGMPMGAVVDHAVAQGHEVETAEAAVWELLQRRRLTPNGFVAREIKRKAGGKTRIYEFTLVAWSPALDAQLDLRLAEAEDSGKDTP